MAGRGACLIHTELGLAEKATSQPGWLFRLRNRVDTHLVWMGVVDEKNAHNLFTPGCI
jgi:hypothetical protein